VGRSRCAWALAVLEHIVNQPKLNCFVASAFGREDVDEIYEKGVRPVLDRLEIRPLRVDKVEHNDDIDDKIIELLTTADLCIADLTYARPSAYYEAGYAFGSGKPVIYTARRDHFIARDNDPEGLRKIHFDLQMKNIIGWSKPDSSFRNCLENRLIYVIKPIKKRLRDERQQQVAIERFSELPQEVRVHEITDAARRLLRTRGFSFPKDRTDKREQPDGFYCLRQKGSRTLNIYFFCKPSATKKSLEGLDWGLSLMNGTTLEDSEAQSHVFYVSLRRVSPSSLSNYLSKYHKKADGTYYRELNAQHPKTPHPITFHIIDGVKTYEDFNNRFKQQLDSYVPDSIRNSPKH
jgi:nucleoside 2-deoxyribosyltransferase